MKKKSKKKIQWTECDSSFEKDKLKGSFPENSW